jgi:hypothetical protein
MEIGIDEANWILAGSEYGPVVGFPEHGVEASGSIRSRLFLTS